MSIHRKVHFLSVKCIIVPICRKGMKIRLERWWIIRYNLWSKPPKEASAWDEDLLDTYRYMSTIRHGYASTWTSCQTRKIARCPCARYAGMHVGYANPRWRGKRSWNSRRLRNPQFYVSGKRPMDVHTLRHEQNGWHLAQDICKCIFTNRNDSIWIEILLKIGLVRWFTIC